MQGFQKECLNLMITNEDKTVKLVHDPKEASRKWTGTRKVNTKWQAGRT